MREDDLLWMTALVFVPTLFALGLIFFPRGKEKAMCWWTLVGTAVTLGISLAMFILFRQGTIDQPGVLTNPADRDKASLDYRVTHTDMAALGSPEARQPNDWVARYPWI